MKKNNDVYILNNIRKFIKTKTTLDTLKSGFVRVKYLYCGICGGDYSSYIGRRTDYPKSLGHEFIAQVISSSDHRFNANDFVVSDFNYRCKSCEYCTQGKSHLCIDNDIQFFSNRGFAQYADIDPNYLLEVNEIENNILAGTQIEPLSCVLHALDCLYIKPCTKILVVGCGNIGTLMAFMLKIVMNQEIVHVKDSNHYREENLINLFQCDSFNIKSEYDLVIEASNTYNGMRFAMECSKMGGQVCSISHLYGVNTSYILELIQKKELQVIFPLRNGELHNLAKAAEYISSYWEKDYNTLIEVKPISEINNAFNKRMNSKYNKSVISCIN